VIEAVEEAVYNALLQAVTTTGVDGHRLEAIDPQVVKQMLDHHLLSAKPA
jgi:D-aminopeptidase